MAGKARGERRTRSAKCLHCGELFSSQGLGGHLRFKHKLGREETNRQVSEATVTAGLAERVAQTEGLVQDLLNARKIRELLGDESKQDGGQRDCCEALKARELEIRNEIRKLDGKPPMVRAIPRQGLDGWLRGPGPELVEEAAEKAPESKSGNGWDDPYA